MRTLPLRLTLLFTLLATTPLTVAGQERSAERSTPTPTSTTPAATTPATTTPATSTPAATTPAPPAPTTETPPAPTAETPSNPFGPTLAYGRVDAATVRVFAVGDVETVQIRGRHVMRVVALPQTGHGTGVVVDPRGVVVTAAHVVEGAHHVAVRLPNGGGIAPATVVHRDDTLDFALLLVLADTPFEHLVALPEAAPTLMVRQTVDAIGYPLDASREQPQSTRGILSAALDDGRLQLGISVNPGNSGGPLIDEHENLVGIVVARGDPSRGVQGIGVAVPVAPIRAAYDTALGGELARAHARLHEAPERWRRSAEVVDALVRLGGADVLREAASIADHATEPERLRALARIARQTEDASLLALLSAFFWDAALVILERSGGPRTPALLPSGGPRQVATQALRKAHELARRARAIDASVARRSPFIAYVVGLQRFAGAEESEEERKRRAQAEAPVGKGWFPLLHMGYASHRLVGLDAVHSLQLTASFPLYLSGDRSSRVRAGLAVGFGLDWSMNWLDYHSFSVFGILELALRIGGPKLAFTGRIGWTPGALTGCDGCEPYEHWDAAPVGFRVAPGMAIGRFDIAFVVHATGVDRPREREWLLQVGMQAGTTF
ncbi:MAG: trypsin-like peptidase domain-containing protein [Myxococcales bacterium]|nr:trypsin-like peptidase domain-containing protein [Myxococcales bacterium]